MLRGQWRSGEGPDGAGLPCSVGGWVSPGSGSLTLVVPTWWACGPGFLPSWWDQFRVQMGALGCLGKQTSKDSSRGAKALGSGGKHSVLGDLGSRPSALCADHQGHQLFVQTWPSPSTSLPVVPHGSAGHRSIPKAYAVHVMNHQPLLDASHCPYYA